MDQTTKYIDMRHVVGQNSAACSVAMKTTKLSSGKRKGPLWSTALLIIFIGYSLLVFARPIPDALHEHTPLRLVGEGKMTWFGFTLYHASLWTSNGSYNEFQDSLPAALHITYDKNIESSQLVNATIDEWERLAIFDHQSRQHWGDRLSTIWPDVKPGDSITTFVTSTRDTIFYANNKIIGQIKDPSVSHALFSIWLHPDTTEPELRRGLIGKHKV